MKKNLKEEAYYERLRKLSNIGESAKPKNTNNNLGTLVDFKRGADNVAYGIVKENHQYFIKKSNKQKEPLVEDFAYIGGLENVHEYRYNKLSDADKNRNMLLITINEALGGKNNMISENKSEKNLLSEEETRKEKNIPGKKQDMDNDGDIDSADYMVKKDAAVEKAMDKKEDKKKDKKEDKKKDKKEDEKEDIDEGAEEELAQAEEKLGDAEEKAEEIPASTDDQDIDLDVDNIDLPPADDTGEESPTMDGADDLPPADDAIEDTPDDLPPADDTGEEGSEESPTMDGADDLPPADDTGEEGSEESPAMDGADEENIRELEKMVGKAGNLVRKTDMPTSKVKYYLNSFISSFEEKLPELEIEERKEIANRILKTVPDSEADLESTDIESSETEMGETKSCEECGFAKYVNERGYGPEELMECGIDEMANLMNGYAMEMDGDVPEEDLANMAILSTDEIAECLKNDYGQTELSENMQPFTDKINEGESASPEAKNKKIEGMFWWETKPQEKKDTTLKTLSEEDVDEGMNGNEPTNTITQPNMIKEDDEEIEGGEEQVDTIDVEGGEERVDLTPGFDTIGGGVPKPDGAETTTVEVTKDSVNVTMNESEKKVRDYIRKRLEEKAGKRKPSLNEDKKSNKIKKLDKMIDEQFELFESILNENGNLSEILGLTNAEQHQKTFKKINPNDPASIEKGFNKIFTSAFQSGARKRVAKQLSPEKKYEIIKQGIEIDGLENPGFTAVEPIVYKPLKRGGEFGTGRSRLGT